jgi:LmbE family N-acetylglucosaminyl deacetylase
MPTRVRKVALSFLAHPDDAEILCAGTLIRLRDAGWEVHIATATPGDCGTMDRNRWEISSVRTQEGAAAAKMIGATYHCLGEGDGLIVYDKPAIQKTVDLFRRIAPSLVFTHAPRDYMLDHEQASHAGARGELHLRRAEHHDVPRHPSRTCRTCTTAIRSKASIRWAIR